MAHWIIETGDEKPFYVSRTPNIQFVQKLEDALHLTKQEALDTLSVLADMQKNSSFTHPDTYTLVCIK
jgi:hypothetical protein